MRAPSLFATLSSDLFLRIWGHFSPQQRLSVERVTPQWRSFSQSFPNSLKRLKEEYPYLITEKVLSATGSECDAIFEKQQKNYAEWVALNSLPSYALKEAHLIYFSRLPQSEKDKKFSYLQVKFLKNFAIASGIMDGFDETEASILLLIAEIGNIQKLKAWREKYEEMGILASGYDGGAHLWAALGGQLECLTYLIESCGQKISSDQKGRALDAAVIGGHLECVVYLMQACGEDITKEDKEATFLNAAERGHLTCVEYFLQTGDISDEIKWEAFEEAIRNNCNAVAGCLKDYLRSNISSSNNATSALTFKYAATISHVKENHDAANENKEGSLLRFDCRDFNL